MKLMDGPLKGYQWTTGSSYEYILGNYEDPQVIDEFCAWLKPDSVFYDLGGNMGFYSLLANRFITTGKIYSFEPIPSNRQIFEEHIALNKNFIKNDNIEILPFAISDKEKQIVFSDSGDQKDWDTYIIASPVFDTAKNNLNVKCYAIDELVQQGYNKPDIIKIDVEGAEYDVLRGAADTLRKYKPFILLATHDYHLPGVKDNCIKFLEKLGYNLRHTGNYNKHRTGLDDYIAIHKDRL